MSTLAVNPHRFRQWVKAQEHPIARRIYRTAKALRGFELPLVKPLYRSLYVFHRTLTGLIQSASRVLYYTPLFRGRIDNAPRRLFLFGGMPLVSGPLIMHIGDDCRISGHTTFSARSSAQMPPVLRVGNNCDIGWQTTIAVGSKVEFGNNVRVAGRSFFAGYPGHPLDADARARGMADTDDQVGDIVLEDDVWLATGVYVMAGVRIGRGTIVAAGSIVTRDLPPGVIAGGVPAKVIRTLDNAGQNDGC